MKRWLQPIIMIALFIFCSWSFIDLLKKNESAMDVLVRESVNMVPALCLGLVFFLITLVIRAHRWSKLLAQPETFWLSYRSISIGYLVQCPLSKLGEIARIGNFKRSNSTPLPTVISTLFVDRLTDVAALFLLVIICLITNSELINQHFPEFASVIPTMSAVLILSFIGIIVLLFKMDLIEKLITQQTFISNNFKVKLIQFINKFNDGFQHCKSVNGIVYLIGTTLVIWVFYVSIFYVMCYFYPASPKGFPFSDIWALFFIGTLGALMPVPGGLGYPLFIQKGLIVVWPIMAQTDQLALATIIFIYNYWALNICLGGLSLLWQITQQRLSPNEART